MSKKLLIVDDDLYLRDLYKEILTDAGYEVETANDGREGLDGLVGFRLTDGVIRFPNLGRSE